MVAQGQSVGHYNRIRVRQTELVVKLDGIFGILSGTVAKNSIVQELQERSLKGMKRNVADIFIRKETFVFIRFRF